MTTQPDIVADSTCASSAKLCRGCGQTRPLSEFYKFKHSKDGHHARCKLCMNAAVHKWRRENAERVNELTRVRAYRDIDAHRKRTREAKARRRKTNPEKAHSEDSINNRRRYARRKGVEGKATEAEIQNIRSMQKDRCAYCRTRLNGGGHLDHIQPLSRGGTHWPNNLQWLCVPCNTSKKARDPLTFARSRGKLL